MDLDGSDMVLPTLINFKSNIDEPTFFVDFLFWFQQLDFSPTVHRTAPTIRSVVPKTRVIVPAMPEKQDTASSQR